MHRGRITTPVLRILFFLALVILFSLRQPLIAQGGEGEPPIIPLSPPELPLLSLAAAPVTIGEFPAPTTPLTVTLTNYGTGAAEGVTLQLDGGLLTLPISQTIGTIEMGQTITTTLPLELQGYTVGSHSLLLTSDAISLTNPIQTTAILTLLEPQPTGFNQPELTAESRAEETSKGTEPTGPTVHLVQAQRPPYEAYRGRILTFNLENNQADTKELTLDLSTWLPGITLNPAALQLSYQPTPFSLQSAALSTPPFTYDPTSQTLTFTPSGDGQYSLATTGQNAGESMGSEAPQDPKGWEPTFNAPTVSLFRSSVDYQYPILTPPGPGLFQPSLGLSYSGSTGNGYASTSQNDIAGFGWNLAGSIEVAQSVTLCPWNPGVLCPVNAYWYDDNPDDDNPGYGRPGLIELTLSLGGTGYELTHSSGNTQNGYPGRYTLKGNNTLYVEYCRFSTSSAVCMNADTGDGTADGAATATQTQGYWVIKDSQNTLYRLGYTTHAEQELLNSVSSGSQMGPWQDGPGNGLDAPGFALRWRVDQVKDRFSNQTIYTYNEYEPSDVNPTWSDDQIHAPSSNLASITYGYNQILFQYSGRGDHMGIPPNSSIYPDVITWQTHLLSRIEVRAKDYETGSGNYNLVRAYQLNYLIERHGNNNDPNIGSSNQSSWCFTQNTSYWGWKLALLTSITELDSNNNARVRVNNNNQPDVEFVYWWYKTALYDTSGTLNDARYCAPYLLELHTPYNAAAPVASFSYNEAPVIYHNANGPGETTTWLNPVVSQSLNGGWTGDAPVQVTQYSYSTPHYGGKANSDQWQEYTGAFQGFQDVTRTVTNNGTAHLLEVSHFLADNFNSVNAPLTGSMEWQELRVPVSNKTLSRSEETWVMQQVTVGGVSTHLPQRTKTIQYSTYYGIGSGHNVGNRTEYTYDTYGNPELIKEYGGVLSGGTPYRVQETLYAHNTSPSNWLIGLPWRVTVWDGEPNPSDPSKIISRQRTRYDGATCAQVNAQTPTNGLITANDTYTPGVGDGVCLSGSNERDYTTTTTEYGQNGDLWWQPTKTKTPQGVYPTVTYQEQTIQWRNHSTLQSIVTALGTTTYGFNDSHTPWLFTDKTAPNGALSRYEYDSFGRLIKQYTPDPATGLATVWSQEIWYNDNQPWVTGNPMFIDVVTMPLQSQSSTSRTFYDALGRVRQQRSWGLSSDIWGTNNSDKVVTDTEYNHLGQVICQSTPAYTPYGSFNANFNCQGGDHTSTSYTRLGNPAITTGIDGLDSSGLALGRTSLAVDPLGRLNVSAQDAFGRLTVVAEIESSEDSFASGSFSGANWWLSPSYTLITSLGSQSVLRVGKSGTGGSTNAATVNQTLGASSSYFFRFQLSGSNHDSRIMVKATDGSEAYLSLEIRNGKIYPGYNSSAGSGTITDIQIDQASNTWYRAHIALNDLGQPTWRVWREDSIGEPDKQFTYTLTNQSINNVLLTKTWQFTLAPGTAGAGTAYLYLGGYQQGHYYVTRYSYDKADNLLTVTDALDNVTTLTYDKLGHKLTMNDPDMGNWSYAYDLAGNLIRQTDANSNRLCFYYDSLNRLSEKRQHGTGTTACPDTPGGTWLASYYYHWSGVGRGQLSSIYGLNNNVGFNEAYSYDYRGRVTSTSRTIAGTSYNLSTSYDLLDRPTTLTYGDGEIVTTGYDKQVANSLSTSHNNSTLVSDVVYNHRLEMTNIYLGNGLTQSYAYYPASNSYRLQTALTAYTATGVGVYNRVYNYDPVGNITQFTTGVIGRAQEVQTFRYDSLGRLKTAKAEGGPAPYDHTGSSTDYDYDPIGNLTSLAGTTLDYEDGSHKHAATHRNGSPAYTYDANGNMVTRVEGGTTYTQAFDVENRLKTVTMSGSTLTTNFAYDASGQRLRTETAPTSPVLDDVRTITTYPFPGYEVETQEKWQCIGPKGGSCTWQWTLQATITRKTYFLGGQAIATRISGDPTSSNNGFFYLHSDHLGSSSLLTYGNGQANPGDKVNGTETRYYPYGSHRLTPTTQLTERDFTGQRENLELGLVYYNARFYVPGLGRFLTADPVIPEPGNGQAYNRYSYVKNNPVIYQDPTGHWAERPHNGGWGSCFDTFGCTEMAHRGNPTGGTCGDDCAFVFGANGVAQEYSISAQEAEGEKGAAVLQVVVAVAYEPADWAMTGYAWSQGDFHVTDLLGLLPLVPAAAVRLARGADNVSDVARYADDAVGAFCSFSEDTLVSTEEGFVPISEVELDDYVLAYNEETGEIGYYPVVAIWAHEDPVIVYLAIEGETIVTTPEHPFYTVEGEWVPAADLQPGVEIRAAAWGSGTVEKVGFSLRPRVMYNFTVAEAHTYFVTEQQWLVHNTCYFQFGNLTDDFNKHGASLGFGIDDIGGYEQAANDLIMDALNPNGAVGISVFSRTTDKSMLVFRHETGEFLVLHDDLTIGTYFRPDDPDAYWATQIAQ